MQRTIEIIDSNCHYKGKLIDYVSRDLRRTFKLLNSRKYKYVITIVEGLKFKLRYSISGYSRADGDYDIYDNDNNNLGFVCSEYFHQIFFKPDANKKYDITVKKILK